MPYPIKDIFCVCPYKSLRGNPFLELVVKRSKVPTQNKENDLEQNPANQFTRLGLPKNVFSRGENLNSITHESLFASSDKSRGLERSTPVEETFQNLTELDEALTNDKDSPSSLMQNQLETFR